MKFPSICMNTCTAHLVNNMANSVAWKTTHSRESHSLTAYRKRQQHQRYSHKSELSSFNNAIRFINVYHKHWGKNDVEHRCCAQVFVFVWKLMHSFGKIGVF